MTTLNYSLSSALVRTLKPGDEVLITQLDHEANRGPWLGLQDRGVIVREVLVKKTGVLDTGDMAAKISSRTKLLALGASSNALGTVNDIALARRLTREAGALLVVDAVHTRRTFRSTCAPWTLIFCSAPATNSTARTWECCTPSRAPSTGSPPTG